MTRPPGDPPASTAFDQAVFGGARQEQQTAPESSVALAQAEAKRHEQATQQNGDYHRWRRNVAIALGIITLIWIMMEIIFMSAYGTGFLFSHRFKASDNVIIAFITTATATIIGLFVIFMRWLFPSKNEEK